MTLKFKPVDRDFYEELAASHPSLLNGLVRCGRCGETRRVDPAHCLQHGWPKCSCGGGTMGLQETPVQTKEAKNG